jgi:hypothetical protein
MAEIAITRCGDTEMRQQFEVLTAEWTRFMATELENQGGILNPFRGEDELPGVTDQFDSPSPNNRVAGSFSTAKLTAWYKTWIDDNTKRGATPSITDDWAAAKAALGDDVPRDAVRAARRESAPLGWQQRGRRKSASEIGDADE